MDNSVRLPFVPQAAAWPWSPLYTGELSEEYKQKLITANVITGDDKEVFDKALAEIRANLTHDNAAEFLRRFSYRLYKANPIASKWSEQTGGGGECFAVDESNAVRRSYSHPFLQSSANDLVLAMDDQGVTTTTSLLTTQAMFLFMGDKAVAPSIYDLKFNQDTLILNATAFGTHRTYGKCQYVSLRHAEHFYDWHRAVAAGKPFEYTPEDISVGPYVLFEYVTAKEQKFVQYWDNQSQYLFHQQIYHPDRYKDKTPEQIAELQGYKRLYKCDVVIPPGQWIKAWAGSNSRTEFTYTIDASQALFPNQVRLMPPAVTWKPDQKERYEKALAVYQRGDLSYQEILDLYDPVQDSEQPDWLVLLGDAYNNPRDSFYDEKKSYELHSKAASLGSQRANSFIGYGWLIGYYGKIDREKAKKWFFSAFNGDDAYAGQQLFNILKKDPLYTKNDQEYVAATDAIFDRARKIGDENVTLSEAQFNILGTRGEKNISYGLRLYERLAQTKPITTRTPVYAIYQLASRYYFGFDVPRDLQKALDYLDKIPKDKGDNIVPPGTRSSVDKLRQLIEDELYPDSAKPWRDPAVLDAQALEERRQQAAKQVSALAQPTPQPMPRPAARPVTRPQNPPVQTPPAQTTQPVSDEAIAWILGGSVAALAGAAYLAWTVRDEVSSAAAGLIVTGGVFKAAHDFEANDVVKFGLTGLTAIGAGFCTYLVATNHLPEGSLISQLWENRWGITTGLGAVTGSYVFIRDWLKDELGIGTAVKTAISGAVVAGSLYLAGFFTQPKQAAAEDPINVANAFVVTKQINVRTSERVERDNVLGQLNCGNGVHTVNGITGDWTEIVLPDRTHAFIASRYLSNNQPAADQCQP